MTSAPIRTVRCYEHSRLHLAHHFEVPVIAVFTKYDQFLYSVEMNMGDYPNEYPGSNLVEVAEKLFQRHYLHPLGNDIISVRLESEFSAKWRGYMLIFFTEMHMKNGHCDGLIEKTAVALNEDIVILMLLAVQKGNLEMSVKIALNWWVHQLKGRREQWSQLTLQCRILF